MPSTFCMVLNGTPDMSARCAFVIPSCFFRFLISASVIAMAAVTSFMQDAEECGEFRRLKNETDKNPNKWNYIDAECTV